MRLLACSALLSLVFSASSPAMAADRYEFDKSHTSIVFYVGHLGFSDTLGNFTEYDGHFYFDQNQPEESKIDVVLYPKGIRTTSAKLDEHLQDENFFNTKQFPEIRFVSKAVEVTGKNTGTVTGDLTMLGVTKPATLQVTFNKADYHPYSKMFVAGFSATGTVKRSEFGMTNLIPAVSDDVRLLIQVEGVNQDRKQAEEIKR